jgi:hypothetical protein
MLQSVSTFILICLQWHVSKKHGEAHLLDYASLSFEGNIERTVDDKGLSRHRIVWYLPESGSVHDITHKSSSG